MPRWTEAEYHAYKARLLSVSFGPEKSAAVEIEADLHEFIFAECRRRGWIALHGSMSERTHRTAGEPDFVILAADGRLVLVECKTRTGKLTPAQQALKVQAEMLGHIVHVVRTKAEALAALEAGA